MCGKSHNNLTPIQNTIILKATKLNECNYIVRYQVFRDFGWILSDKIAPNILNEVNDLKVKGVIVDYNFSFFSDKDEDGNLFTCAELMLFCCNDNE